MCLGLCYRHNFIHSLSKETFWLAEEIEFLLISETKMFQHVAVTEWTETLICFLTFSAQPLLILGADLDFYHSLNQLLIQV